jgi:REP element-mobilizing transposase RayT
MGLYKNAAYFITICTFKMKHYFGKITNDKMIFSKSGKIVDTEWNKTPKIRKYVILDEYVIMPNHFHGILFVSKDIEKNSAKNETSQRDVSTGSTNYLKPDSLGSILGQFKTKCTKKIRANINSSFKWQDRFHDRIIRDEKELQTIREYIFYNPLNWKKDKFYGKDN